ncbi:hypothetical protein [Cryobacterium sp. Y50]|uniref:hypothetical protein n=1 Tax=Cryobacterium sp. Y50 TaxID=2048286 RepID=UPI000CE492AC|nr:hypothetical protein [Cryobacterium sp. Y50]
MSTATFTDLLRKPKQVLAHIDEGQVHITRRDGDDLVILRGHDLAILEDGVALSSQLIRAIGRNEGNITVALTDLFAWAGEFSADELTDYAAQIERLVLRPANWERSSACCVRSRNGRRPPWLTRWAYNRWGRSNSSPRRSGLIDRKWPKKEASPFRGRSRMKNFR